MDFATGAIYLPRGETSDIDKILSRAEIDEYPLAGRELDDILALIEAETGLEIDPASIWVRRGARNDAIEPRLRELNARIARTAERRADDGTYEQNRR